MTLFTVSPENFTGTKEIYDVTMADNVHLHDIVYPHVFGKEQYIGQFSDNSREELELMGSLMALQSTSSVLDVGCGRGNIAAHMAQVFHWDITGVDLSEVPIAQARQRHQSRSDLSLKFIQGSIYDMASDEQFDGIYGTGAFCHFDAKKLFTNCYSMLKPGGKLAFMERVRIGEISAQDWECLTTQWCCPYVYSLEEYKALLTDCGFTVRHSLDLTDNFKKWQSRSVTCREELKEVIIKNSSQAYYESSLAYAKYENDVTESGALGYVCLVVEKE